MEVSTALIVTGLLSAVLSGVALMGLLSNRITEVKIFGHSIKFGRVEGDAFSNECTHYYVKFRSKASKGLKAATLCLNEKFEATFRQALIDKGVPLNCMDINSEITGYKNAIDATMLDVLRPQLLYGVFENGFHDPDSEDFISDVKEIIMTVFRYNRKEVGQRWCSNTITRTEYLEEYLNTEELRSYIESKVISYFRNIIKLRNVYFGTILTKYPKRSKEDIEIEWKIIYG